MFAENLAYKKEASSSSQFSADFSADKAVDMDDDSCLSSGHAASGFSWIRIDLDDSYFIHEVLLFARATCCNSGSSLHSFELRIGEPLFCQVWCKVHA